MELVDMRVLGTRAFGVSVRVRPGAMEKEYLPLSSYLTVAMQSHPLDTLTGLTAGPVFIF